MRRFLKYTVFWAVFCCFLGWGATNFAALSQDQRKELSLRYYRGVVYFEAGRYEDALQEFQAVTSIDPYYKDAQKYSADCVKTLERYRQDVIGASQEPGKDQKAFDLYFLGKSYFEKGDYRRALEAFRAVLEKNPNDKFAQYYIKLCRDAMPSAEPGKKKLSGTEQQAINLDDLEKEVAYIKSDIREQEDVEKFLRAKAERKSERDDLIRFKERQLKEQEELLEEERQDYVAQAKISKQSEKIKRETEKWRNMKEKLASEQSGVPADLTQYPQTLDKAEKYYVEMNEALRTSRWNAAGLNAINASINYCDSILIYFYNVESAEPRHENITRLLLANVKRADTDANVYHMRSILNLKRLIDDEDRPITRAEAIFLSGHAEKLVEWCKSILP
jgi:tetratricopeptide (TPR) repeat protein